MESAVEKCLAFCQALITSDQKFTLNISIGNDKIFFSNKELESSWKKRKKVTKPIAKGEKQEDKTPKGSY